MAYKTNPKVIRYSISMGWYCKTANNSAVYTHKCTQYLLTYLRARSLLLSRNIVLLKLRFAENHFILPSKLTTISKRLTARTSPFKHRKSRRFLHPRFIKCYSRTYTIKHKGEIVRFRCNITRYFSDRLYFNYTLA